MIAISAAVALVLQAEPLPRPDLSQPVWSYGLTADFVPGTSHPPSVSRPDGPVETWWWRFFAREGAGPDTLVSRIRIDCSARTFQLLSHVGIRRGAFTDAEPAVSEPPALAEAGSAVEGLIVHLCDPDPAREVRRYTNAHTARETMDDYFADRGG